MGVNMVIDEILLYGGITVFIISIVTSIICIIFFKIRRKNLDVQFDIEYGPIIEKSIKMDEKEKGSGVNDKNNSFHIRSDWKNWIWKKWQHLSGKS